MAIEYYFSEGQLVNIETHFLIAVSSLRLALKVCYLPPTDPFLFSLMYQEITSNAS